MCPFVLPKKRAHTCYKPLGRGYAAGSIWLCNGCGRYWLLVDPSDALPVERRWKLLTQEEALQLIADASGGETRSGNGGPS